MTALKSSPASPLTSPYVDFFELGAQDWKAGAQRSLQALAPTLVRCQAIDEGYFGDTGRARVDCLMSFWIEQRSQAGWLQASLEDLIGVTEDFRMGLVD